MTNLPSCMAMRSLLLCVCVAGLSCQAFADRSVGEYEMREVLIPGKGVWTYTFTVGGVSCATVDELKRAVARLPLGSKLTWNVGCIRFSSIPLGSGQGMKVEEFEAYCAEHRVTFRIRGGW